MVRPVVLLANGATTGFFGLVLFAMLYSGPSMRCEAAGGRWAAVTESCITRSCFQSGTCGQWAHPAARCSELEVGDGRAEVYFQLGEPDEVRADEATWHADKGSSEVIVASFRGDSLQGLSCPARP